MNIQAPLIIDIEGFELTASDKKRLKNPLTGGLILFGIVMSFDCEEFSLLQF